MTWTWETRVDPVSSCVLWLTDDQATALEELLEERLGNLRKLGEAGVMPAGIVELEGRHLHPIAARLKLLQEVE